MTRPQVQALKAYVPGTSTEELQRRLGLTHVIKLASNENPLGASPKAMAALANIEGLHLYFDDSHEELRARLGAPYELLAKNVVLGHGSNELVRIICETMLDAGDEAVMAAPSFSLYPLAATLQGARPVEVPLAAGTHDLEAMLAAVTARTKVLFVCDPNNPTGTALSPGQWRDFLLRVPAHVTLVIDQAYREYAGEGTFDAAFAVKERPATVVLRTMSKIYGLASLRFGYGFADEATIGWLNRVRLPFNVSRPAALGAAGALDDHEFVRASIEANISGKVFICKALDKLGLHAYPTQANFYAVQIPGTATRAYEDLLQRGIIVRSGDALGMPGRLRITIGSAPQNNELVQALGDLLPVWKATA